MKTTTSSRKFPTLVAALAISIMSGLSLQTAQADYIVTLQQVGPNVVATGSGAFDLTPLFFASLAGVVPDLNPGTSRVSLGPLPFGAAERYIGAFIGPSNFGSGGLTTATSGSGDAVSLFFDGAPNLIVPPNYQSGTALSDTATYNSATFASLGVTPGTYKWTWGTGVNESFTLQIGSVASTPDSGSTLGLLALALATLVGASRLRFIRLA